jgi:hypothetical protein
LDGGLGLFAVGFFETAGYSGQALLCRLGSIANSPKCQQKIKYDNEWNVKIWNFMNLRRKLAKIFKYENH